MTWLIFGYACSSENKNFDCGIKLKYIPLSDALSFEVIIEKQKKIYNKKTTKRMCEETLYWTIFKEADIEIKAEVTCGSHTDSSVVSANEGIAKFTQDNFPNIQLIEGDRCVITATGDGAIETIREEFTYSHNPPEPLCISC